MQRWIKQLYTYCLKYGISILDCYTIINYIDNCIVGIYFNHDYIKPATTSQEKLIPVQEFIDRMDEFKDYLDVG